MVFVDIDRWKAMLIPHGAAYVFLSAVIFCLLVLTSIYGTLWRHKRDSSQITSPNNLNTIIGFPPRLPNDRDYVQWTFLHMNDVYELLPQDNGHKGGLARVAYLRQLLLEENPSTYTILAGDFVSPSALSTAKVNGRPLNGRQMIATMNSLGLDYVTFGNHEFDITENELLSRMNESNFSWISSNVFKINSNQPIGSSLTYKILTISRVRILLIGLTLATPSTYARFTNDSSLVNYTRQFLAQFPNESYDVLVALTHLDIARDIELASNIPQIDLILGGHEHEDVSYLRGPKYTPIHKADANAYTVFIHRCVYNIDTKEFRVYSTLTRVTEDIAEEEKTANVAKHWYNLGIQAFTRLGYVPQETISCLPAGVNLDGRSEAIRSSQTLLSDTVCKSMMYATSMYRSTISIFNSGAIRIDDILRDTIIGYDVLRVLPFVNYLSILSVPGTILSEVLRSSMMLKGNGMFLSYNGIQTSDGGTTWLADGVNVATSGMNYTIVTIDYARVNTGLNHSNVSVVKTLNITQTNALMTYLKIKYPPC
ncbi:unnamed protein product [Adineta ricciae]|uniref:5'-nucleotidase n=2 Tax=Adineta ricciae TaxID=249248 RepID=A0A814Y6H2_ADIRI|nr:unnamed protein product [Adineta ricciae]